MDTNKHKFLMMQILKDIYKDSLLSSCLAFKGGTSLMFFYQLTRFSVDLDFNLLDCTKQHVVYEKLQKIAHKYGQIKDSHDLLRFFSEFPSIQEYHDSKMVVDKSVIEQKNNDNWEIKAVIDGKEYDSKQISASDKQLYCSLNMEEEKAGLAIIFAKKYFVNEYNRNQ